MGSQISCQNNDEFERPTFAKSLSNMDLELFVDGPSSGMDLINKEVSIPVEFTPSVAFQNTLSSRRVRIEGVFNKKKSLKRFRHCVTENNLRVEDAPKKFNGSKRSSLPMELLRKDFVALYASQSCQKFDLESADLFLSSECLSSPIATKRQRSNRSSTFFDIQTFGRLVVRASDARSPNLTPRFEAMTRWPSKVRAKRSSGSAMLKGSNTSEEFKELRCFIDEMIRHGSDSHYLPAGQTPHFSEQLQGFNANDKSRQSEIINDIEAAELFAEGMLSGSPPATLSPAVVSRLPGKMSVDSSFAEDNAPCFRKFTTTSSYGGCSIEESSSAKSNTEKPMSEVGEYMFDLADRIRVLTVQNDQAPELKEFATEIEILTRRFEKLLKGGSTLPEEK